MKNIQSLKLSDADKDVSNVKVLFLRKQTCHMVMFLGSALILQQYSVFSDEDIDFRYQRKELLPKNSSFSNANDEIAILHAGTSN